MGRIARGWNRGLGDGMEGSGAFIGFVIPSAIAVVFLVLLSIGCAWCYNKISDPGPCVNYVYSMGLFAEDTAKCTKWAAMDMRIEHRYIKNDLVHCTCTAESLSKR